MRISVLSLLIALTITSCNNFKDKPRDDRDVYRPKVEEPILPPIEDELLGSSLEADGLGEGYNTQTIDQTSLSGINIPSQEELIAVAGDRIFFGTDSYRLSSSAKSIVRKQANWLMQNPNITVSIEGHCDERGTREYNLALGERRANSIKNYLVEMGVNPSRINTISYGKEFPEFLGSSEASWSKNRRGVTVVN